MSSTPNFYFSNNQFYLRKNSFFFLLDEFSTLTITLNVQAWIPNSAWAKQVFSFIIFTEEERNIGLLQTPTVTEGRCLLLKGGIPLIKI